MPQVTYFVAIPFYVSENGEIVAGTPRECRDGGAAGRLTATMAADPRNCRAIAIAFSRSGDPVLGDFDDAVIIKSIGEVHGAVI